MSKSELKSSLLCSIAPGHLREDFKKNTQKLKKSISERAGLIGYIVYLHMYVNRRSMEQLLSEKHMMWHSSGLRSHPVEG